MAEREEVLVIGGAGFIGSRLVSVLAASGCRVRVMSRHAGAGRQEPGVRYFRGEVADQNAVRAAVAGTAVVYQLAMGGGETWEEYRRDFVEGTGHVARACQEHGVRRLIFASSTAALDLARKGRLDESAGADPEPESRNFYSRGKIEAERLLLQLHARERLPVVILRPALVVGRGGQLTHAGAGFWREDICCVLWGKGRHPLPFVLVDDVAQAFLAAKDAPDIEGLAFNLAGDVRPSSVEYVRLLAERSLRNYRVYPQSLVKMQAIAIFKWVIKKLVRKPGATWPNYHDLKCNAVFAQLDCSLAKRMLGWKPTDSFEVFVREAIDLHLPPIHPDDPRLAPHSLRAAR